MTYPIDLQKLAKVVGSALVVAIGTAIAMPANAQTIDSAYTDLDLAQCTTIERDGYDTSWVCGGYAGFLVLVNERQGRFSVSYGLDAAGEQAATQIFIPDADRLGPRVEWRLLKKDGVWHPFATILRWHYDGIQGNPASQALVVTGIEPGNTCHVASIDVGMVDDANEVARQFADDVVFDFECAHEDPYLVPS